MRVVETRNRVDNLVIREVGRSAAPNQSTDVDSEETGKQNARLVGNRYITNEMSESYVDWVELT